MQKASLGCVLLYKLNCGDRDVVGERVMHIIRGH